MRRAAGCSFCGFAGGAGRWPSYGVEVAERRARQHDDGLRTSARSRFRAGRWCSLSIGAWLPAPRRIMAAQCAEPPDVLFADLPAAPADGRATGSRSPSAARASMMMAFGRLLALRFRAGRWCSLSIGAWLPAPRRIMAAQCAEPPDVLFADLPAAPADGRATGSRSPSAARASMMMAFGRLLALRFRAGRWCSLSIGAWLPAPRRIMAAQCAEPPDVLFADLPAAPADGRATGSRSPSAGASMMMAFGRLLALDSGLGVGALYPLARGCRRRAGSWPLKAITGNKATANQSPLLRLCL